MMETADAQWVKSLVRQLTKCLELPILRNHPWREHAGNTSVMWTLNIFFKIIYDKLHAKRQSFRVKAYHLPVVHFAPRLSQYKERPAALSLRILLCFRSMRTHWLAGCPVVMIDRSAEGPHCGELGQGVALFLSYCPHSFTMVIFHFDWWPSHHGQISIHFLSAFFLSHWLTFVSVLFVFLWLPSY